MRFRVIASACVVVLLGGGWTLAQSTGLSSGFFIARAPLGFEYTNSQSSDTWCRACAERASDARSENAEAIPHVLSQGGSPCGVSCLLSWL
jgi:hypothetical protein